MFQTTNQINVVIIDHSIKPPWYVLPQKKKSGTSTRWPAAPQHRLDEALQLAS